MSLRSTCIPFYFLPYLFWKKMYQRLYNIRYTIYLWYPNTPDSKVHEANMGPTWVLSAPDGPILDFKIHLLHNISLYTVTTKIVWSKANFPTAQAWYQSLRSSMRTYINIKTSQTN